jgi:transposase
MKKYKVTLTQEERKELEALSNKGKHAAQTMLNALILLACDEGEYQIERSINETIARVLNISMKTIDRVKKRFIEEGFDVALTGKPSTRVYRRKADGDFEAHLIALSCSAAPEGHKRWTLRLLADKVVELDYVDNISYETVRRVLKKTSLSLGKRMDG